MLKKQLNPNNMKRTFEYNDGKSNKFWTIDANETEFTITFGKVGTNGQSQTKTFSDEAACQKEAEKLIREKTRKGYVEANGTMPKANPQKTEVAVEKPAKKYQTFMKAFEKGSDTSRSDWALDVFNVDIEDPQSIIATLQAVCKKLNNGAFVEKFEGEGSFPLFGSVKDKIFTPLTSDNEDDDTLSIFYRKAAECEAAREELLKVCKQIIRMNNRNMGCPTWETEEILLGVNQAFALAMVDKQYIKVAIDMMLTMANGDHSTPFEPVKRLFAHWGATPETLAFGVAFITRMPLQDIGAAEYLFTKCFGEYLKEETNINVFLKIYAQYLKDGGTTPGLFEQIFPDREHQELAKKFMDLVEDNRTPTLKLLTKEPAKKKPIKPEPTISEDIQFPYALSVYISGKDGCDIDSNRRSDEIKEGLVIVADNKRNYKQLSSARDATIDCLKIIKDKLAKKNTFRSGEAMLTADSKPVDITQEQLDEWLAAIPKGAFIYDPTNMAHQRTVIKAVREGDFELLQQYIKHGLNAGNEFRDSPKNKIYLFDVAIEALQPQMIRFFSELYDSYVKNGMPPNEYSFFSIAARCEDKALLKVRAMLDNGYDVKKDPCIASCYPEFDLPQNILDYLLEHIDSSNTDIDTIYKALSWEIKPENKKPERIIQLIDKGVQILQPSSHDRYFDGNTALHLAVKNYGSYIDVIKKFIDNGADPNAKNENGRTPLEEAIYCDYNTMSAEVATYLYPLTDNFNPYIHGVIGKFGDNIDIVKLLLNENTDYNRKWYGSNILETIESRNNSVWKVSKEVIEFVKSNYEQAQNK